MREILSALSYAPLFQYPGPSIWTNDLRKYFYPEDVQPVLDAGLAEMDRNRTIRLTQAGKDAVQSL